jgi:four helix bundle protein
VPTFKSFEEIQAWQKAREATRRVYEITADKRFVKDIGLSSQLQRASVSMMATLRKALEHIRTKSLPTS